MIASVSVFEAVQDFLASSEVKRLVVKTRQEYTYALTTFAEWCAQNALTHDKKTRAWSVIKPRDNHESISLRRVDDQVVYLFLEHIKATHKPSKASAEKLSDHTLLSYVKCIKRLLHWCLLDEEYSEYVKAITVERIQRPSLEETVIETFDADQIEALMSACTKERYDHLQVRDKIVLLLLLDTGIRAAELVTLTIGHVHLDPKDAHIRVHGKGSKWREVGLGEEARRAIVRYIRQYRELAVEDKIQPQLKKLPVREAANLKKQLLQQECLVVNRSYVPLTISGLHRLVERLGEWAHIEGVRCSPHTFRHTFAVNFMRANNNDIYRLSKLLGHTSVRVTENYLRSWKQSEARRGAKSVADTM